MMNNVPEALGIIAGNGVYPRLLALSARKQGVKRIFSVAFRRETDRSIETVSDEVRWIYLGQLGAMLDALSAGDVKVAVMAGQITPTHLFNIRMDGRMLELLKSLKARNAETIFGAVAKELASIGVDLIPASTFMEDYMPGPGLLTTRPPTESESRDIELGLSVAKATSGLDIGQTVVVKQGTILAVEAFEGTDATIMRAAELGGAGSVIVKVAKQGHDMRFDIPVIGMRTLKTLRKAKASVLAFEAGRAVVLEHDVVVKAANKMNLSLISVAAPPGA